MSGIIPHMLLASNPFNKASYSVVPGESVELQAKRKGVDDRYVVGGKGMIYLLIYHMK